MKKLLLVFTLVIAAVALIGCDQTTTITTTTTTTTAAPVAVEFPVDGEFTAYSLTVSSNKPQVTMVTVTIENGEIVAFNLDCRQGTRTNTGTTEAPAYTWAWNAQTKKELGYGYKMHYSKYTADPAVTTPTLEGYQAWMEAQTTYKEWFQQANILEALWLEDGVYAAHVDGAGEFTDVAGVSVSNSEYIKLARQAVDLARAGKFQTFVCTGTDFYFAYMIVNNLGEVTELKIDTIQATKDATAGTFVWNPYSKQELGMNYGMKGVGAAQVFSAGTWTASATEKSAYEWYEQANLISAWVLANGYDENLQSIGGRGLSIDGTTLLDGTAGVTVHSDTYVTLLDQLFALPGEGALK